MMKIKKQLVDSELVRSKIDKLMAAQSIDYDTLSERVTSSGYAIDKANLQMYVNKRDININLGYALSKSFGVSLDFLFNNDIPDSHLDGFDYDFGSKRYAKYHGNYYAYFCPTQDSKQHLPIEANFSYNKDSGLVILEIATKEGASKLFSGNMIISDTTRTLFITLRSEIGEIVQVIMNDQELNTQNFEICMGMAISVSAGDFKRIPVAHRFIICRNKLSDPGKEFLSSHLNMNNKFIQIKESRRISTRARKEKRSELVSVILNILNPILQNDAENTAELILTAIQQKTSEVERLDLLVALKDLIEPHFPDDAHDMAETLLFIFVPEQIISLEEHYLLNTFGDKFGLTESESELLISILRTNSISQSNWKIKENLDSRIYRYLKANDGFISK